MSNNLTTIEITWNWKPQDGLENIHWMQTVHALLSQPCCFSSNQSIKTCRLTQNSVHSLHSVDAPQNGTKVMQRETEESLFFVFFTYKKYPCRFIQFRLNHWWQIVLDLNSAIYLTVNGSVTIHPIFNQNILNCLTKTNKASPGLERVGGKWLMTKFSFWGGVTI